jgi:hypothetical protein
MKLSSLRLWFMLLLSLNVFDILTTIPAYEANPVTLYIWSRSGFFLAAWFKIGLVLLFGLLCIVAQKMTKPNEWSFTKKVLIGLLRVLVVFYVFVVIANLAVSIV